MKALLFSGIKALRARLGGASELALTAAAPPAAPAARPEPGDPATTTGGGPPAAQVSAPTQLTAPTQVTAPTPPTQLTVARDCPANLIPDGTPVVLPAGASVTVTQALGSSVTILWAGNLARVGPMHLDALGWRPSLASPTPPGDAPDLALPLAPAPLDAAAVEEAIWECLRSCYDPEIPINIVELGLVYGCRAEWVTLPETPETPASPEATEATEATGATGAMQPPAPARSGYRAAVTMTLTAPGCGMGEYIKADVENRLQAIPGVTEAQVELVWDPPWNQELMTEAAKLELGLM